MQQIVNGANKTLAAVEGGLSARVGDLQSVIGREARSQMRRRLGRDPDAVIACVGGGSNAIGIFHPFLDVPGVRLVGVEASGHGMGTGKHAATLSAGAHGILHGARSYLLQDELGQVSEAHSISAGLDYPGVGPEHSWLRESGLATYETATDDEALAALERLSRTEGIIPALETAHAVAFAIRLAPTLPRTAVLLLNLSGRGDKDMETVATALGVTLRGETPPPAAVPSRARGDA